MSNPFRKQLNLISYFYRRHTNMSGSESPLSQFLSRAKSHLAESIKTRENITLVAGNQSADLDSFVSSVLFAYLRSFAPPPNAFTPLYIPLLNVPGADIKLRPEFKALFKHAGISASQLISLDDLPPVEKREEELPPSRTQWIIVDHNKLEGDLGNLYGSRVLGVIDHHEEENAVPEETGDEPRIVEPCGSCTSLVVRYFADEDPSLKARVQEAGEDPWNLSVARFALGPIVVDTKNLRDEFKVKPTDLSSASFLISKIRDAEGGSGALWVQNDFWKELSKAKKDIEGLPLQGILRKDYKEWTEGGLKLGMSTVVKPLKFLVSKAQDERKDHSGKAWDATGHEFVSARKLDIWTVGTTFTTPKDEGGEYARELCIQWQSKKGGEAVARFVKKSGQELGLEGKKISGIEVTKDVGERGRYVFRQWEVSKSRKQVGPLLRSAMRGDSS